MGKEYIEKTALLTDLEAAGLLSGFLKFKIERFPAAEVVEMNSLEAEENAVTPPDEPLTPEFDVVDTTTGEYPDWGRIAREESWAKGLVYCDMDGIAILEDGSLILLDECGNCVPCPPDRFEIRFLPGGGDGA